VENQPSAPIGFVERGHFLAVKLIAVSTSKFASIHGGIGVFLKSDRVVPILGVEADPYAGAGEQLMTFDSAGNAQGFKHAIGGLRDRGRVSSQFQE
jgi:hypothetical protein